LINCLLVGPNMITKDNMACVLSETAIVLEFMLPYHAYARAEGSCSSSSGGGGGSRNSSEDTGSSNDISDGTPGSTTQEQQQQQQQFMLAPLLAPLLQPWALLQLHCVRLLDDTEQQADYLQALLVLLKAGQGLHAAAQLALNCSVLQPVLLLLLREHLQERPDSATTSSRGSSSEFMAQPDPAIPAVDLRLSGALHRLLCPGKPHHDGGPCHTLYTVQTVCNIACATCSIIRNVHEIFWASCYV
jgi:hypothetical protein